MTDLFGRADPKHESFAMAEWPFYWIARISRRYTHEMEVVLKRIGMDVARWRVLIILNELEPASVSEIAEHAVIKLSTISKTIMRLQADGLVITAPRASDARVTEVRLTDYGRDVLILVREQASRVFRKAFAEFDEAQISDLNSTLQLIFARLDNPSI